MDITNIANWLKNTITGIVLLGAAGSIVAIFILWVAKKFFIPLIKNYLSQLFKSLIDRIVNISVDHQIDIYITDDKYRGIAYYAVKIMQFITALFIASVSLVLFLYSLAQPSENLMRRAIVIPIIVFFTSLWISIKILLRVYLPYLFEVGKTIANKIEERSVTQVGSK